MATAKRPLSLAEARLAKRQKIDAKEPEERQIASTGSAYTDLLELLNSALTTGDAAWFRAVIHEADRLLRVNAAPDQERGEEDPLDLAMQRDSVRTASARALVGLGALVTADGSTEKPRAGEPASMGAWLEAAEEQLAYLEEISTFEVQWLRAIICLHRARLGEDVVLDEHVRALSAWSALDEEQRPTDSLEAANLLLAVSAEHSELPIINRALLLVEEMLRELEAEDPTPLADCLLLIASRTAEKVEEEAEQAGEDWILPQTEEIDDAREAALEAAAIYARLLASLLATDGSADELKANLGEALIVQANLTADLQEREELYARAEAEAGILIDAEG